MDNKENLIVEILKMIDPTEVDEDFIEGLNELEISELEKLKELLEQDIQDLVNENIENLLDEGLIEMYWSEEKNDFVFSSTEKGKKVLEDWEKKEENDG